MTETSPSSGLLASLRRAKEDLTIGCGDQQRSLLALHEASGGRSGAPRPYSCSVLISSHGDGHHRGEPRRLADFLRTHRETILSNWLTAVRSLAPARRLDRPMLIDHLPQYLDDLADFLDEVRAGHTAPSP